MPRSTNAPAAKARKKRILQQAKGFWGRRKNVWTIAKNAVEKSLTYAYRDRRNKKRAFRALWVQRIGAAARQHGLTYAHLMHRLAACQVGLNRKVLADLAMHHSAAFAAVVQQATPSA